MRQYGTSKEHLYLNKDNIYTDKRNKRNIVAYIPVLPQALPGRYSMHSLRPKEYNFFDEMKNHIRSFRLETEPLSATMGPISHMDHLYNGHINNLVYSSGITVTLESEEKWKMDKFSMDTSKFSMYFDPDGPSDEAKDGYGIVLRAKGIHDMGTLDFVSSFLVYINRFTVDSLFRKGFARDLQELYEQERTK